MNKIGATVGHLVGIDVEFYYRVWFKTRIRRHFIKYFRLNHQILSPLSKTPELIGMKNFAIQNRVLQMDRVLLVLVLLKMRVLER